MKKICATVESSTNVLLFIAAVTMIILGILQILFRYAFSASLSWSEECMRYLHVWVTTIGGTICFYAGTFTVITIVSDRIEAASKGAGKFLTVLRYVIPYIFYGIMLYEGILICSAYMPKLSATTRISMGVIYLCIPLSGLLGLVFSVAKLPEFIDKMKGGLEK